MIDNSTRLNVILMGATGAVGAHVLATLAAMPDVARISVLARRKPESAQAPKVEWHVVDVLAPASYVALLPGHQAAICTLGVGEPSKVSREEFTRVDRDAVLAFARACKEAGVGHFELLGSVAADPASSNFYLKSKGALREQIAAVGFRRFTTFQPSMLLTPANRYGLSQAILLKVWPVVSPLLFGPLRKYRGIRVEALGAAMARHVLTAGEGSEILHWDDFGGWQTGS
jgi:uncharacterized protein YbjT (DUF2867 family)